MGFFKVSAILFAMAAFYGFEVTKVYVPEGFERPYLYRSMVTVFRLTGKAAQLAARFNIGDEVSNFRNILSVMAGAATKLDDPDVSVEFQLIENEVPVRIYSPSKAASSANLPLVIFYHGGGYVLGTPETYELFLFEFVKKLNIRIISVNYKLAPEYPYPIPTEECYLVTKHIMQNPTKFKIDASRVALMGDSAGGNAVAVVAQRLLAEKLPMPKLQVLIYPWLQLFDHQLPSCMEYSGTGLISTTLSGQKMSAHYVGFKEVSEDLERAIMFNNHTALVTDKAQRQKIMSYLDVSKIPDKYKRDRAYYKRYDMIKKSLYPERLDEGDLFKKNKRAADLVNRFADPRVSPLLADDSKLVGLPKAYVLVLEWDSLKDEALLYAERLRKAGVHVDTGFYEHAFHGIITFTHPTLGFQKAFQIRADMVNYLKSNL